MGGPVTVEFSDKTKCNIFLPDFRSDKLTWDKRRLYYKGKAGVTYENFDIKSYINFDKSSELSRDSFNGKIYYFDRAKETMPNTDYRNISEEVFGEGDLKDQISTVEGRYLENLQIDANEIWTTKRDKVIKAYNTLN